MPRAAQAAMKKLREKMALVMWIVAITFIGLMVLQWGADITGIKSRKAQRGVIGLINGKPLTMREYEEMYRRNIENAQRSGTEITDELEENIRQQTWRDMVTRTILLEKAKNLTLDMVTPEEIYQNLLKNPPEILRQQEAFMTNGQFDYAKYQAAIKNPSMDWRPVEYVVKSNLPFEKLQQVIQMMTFVSPLELQEVFVRQSEKVKVKFVRMTPAVLVGFSADTSEEALRAFYESNKDKYRHDEFGRLKYVKIPFFPSAKDSAEAKAEIYEVYNKLKQGEDFAQVARDYSQDYGSAQAGGSLGFFRRGQMIKEFEDVAFSLKPGQFSEPFLTNFGWHIVKVDSTRGKADSLELKASHILIRLEPSVETRDSVRALADSIKMLADSLGLEEAIARFPRYNLNVQISASFGRDDVIEGVGNHPELADFAFTARPRSVFRVLSSGQAYYIYEAFEHKPAGIYPFEEIRDRVKSDYLMEKKKEAVKARMQELYDKWKSSGVEFDTFFEKNYSKPETTGYFSRADFVGVVNNDPSFKAYAFTLTRENPVSPVVSSELGDAYIIELVDKIPVDWSNFSAQRDKLFGTIYQAKRNQIYNRWFEKVKSASKIEDLRNKLVEE